jgi:hypothetical protein
MATSISRKPGVVVVPESLPEGKPALEAPKTIIEKGCQLLKKI